MLSAKTKCLHQKHHIQVSARTTAITCESIMCIIVYLCLVARYRGCLSFQCPSVSFHSTFSCSCEICMPVGKLEYDSENLKVH